MGAAAAARAGDPASAVAARAGDPAAAAAARAGAPAAAAAARPGVHAVVGGCGCVGQGPGVESCRVGWMAAGQCLVVEPAASGVLGGKGRAQGWWPREGMGQGGAAAQHSCSHMYIVPSSVLLGCSFAMPPLGTCQVPCRCSFSRQQPCVLATGPHFDRECASLSLPEPLPPRACQCGAKRRGSATSCLRWGCRTWTSSMRKGREPPWPRRT